MKEGFVQGFLHNNNNNYKSESIGYETELLRDWWIKMQIWLISELLIACMKVCGGFHSLA